MTVHRLKRGALRMAALAVLAAAVFSGAPVGSQPAAAPQLPRVDQAVTVPAATKPAPSHSMATTGRGAQAESHVGLPATNAVTHRCSNSPRSETRLGLLENTAMYSHCDYP
jgi:hypothetical protein